MDDGTKTENDDYRQLTRSQIDELQRTRLAEAVAHARSGSGYYGELYSDLPDGVSDIRLLPVTDKQQLMARFEDWVTDPKVKLADVMAFANDSTMIGEPFAGEYIVTTTSGTTGTRGMFLTDRHSAQVIRALHARSFQAMSAGTAESGRSLDNDRMTAIVATHGHFGAYTGMLQMLKADPERAKKHQTLSVLRPVDELVMRLNEFRPGVLSSYPTVARLLAAEQEAGRLRINLALVALGGEGVSEADCRRLGQAFDARVSDMYASNECPALAVSCGYGRQHVNEDWVVFEPVDSQYRPTPPGETSHTVLLSVLFRREQPILRYDLGDSVTVHPGPCECGSPFMAVRVHGRASDVVSFPGPDGKAVTIVPLALETLVENTMDVETFQIIQTGPTALRLRLRISEGADRDAVWEKVSGDLRRLLDDRRLDDVRIERASEEPEQSEGGKYRMIVPLPGT